MEFKDLKVGDLFIDVRFNVDPLYMKDTMTIYRKEADHALSPEYGEILVGVWGSGGKATFPMNGKVVKLV